MKITSWAIAIVLAPVILFAQSRTVRPSMDKRFNEYCTSNIFEGKSHKNERLPAFSLPTPDGRILRSADMKGKVLVLDFWATWCAPCRKLTAELDSSLKKYQERKDFQMIGMDYNETVVNKGLSPAAYWKEHKYGFPMTLNNNEYGKSLNAGNPTVIVVDKDGIMRGKWDAWTPHTAEEISVLVWALLEDPRITEADVNKAYEKKEYLKTIHLCDLFMATYPAETGKFAAIKYNARMKMSSKMEALTEVKFVLDTITDYKAFTNRLLGNDTISPSATRTQLFEELMKQAGQEKNYLIYELVAGNYYKAGNRKAAVENAEKALQIARQSGKNAGPMIEQIRSSLEEYRKE
ncbi:TlpA family protein disulfide reductase [Chitinophaga tropicalis]|uniref:Redoxin domain-containing protein n=1 Tax=Chitinophaga tropicalis TaxID=2683588 RepID=A0A7K1U377_9BACT|nr:TlpA disulfide reductase family protein [Chitinophaga tropicalis]MVT08808.1 redoxin domain-containing protein [Chitinophaga tropicalis]